MFFGDNYSQQKLKLSQLNHIENLAQVLFEDPRLQKIFINVYERREGVESPAEIIRDYEHQLLSSLLFNRDLVEYLYNNLHKNTFEFITELIIKVYFRGNVDIDLYNDIKYATELYIESFKPLKANIRPIYNPQVEYIRLTEIQQLNSVSIEVDKSRIEFLFNSICPIDEALKALIETFVAKPNLNNLMQIINNSISYDFDDQPEQVLIQSIIEQVKLDFITGKNVELYSYLTLNLPLNILIGPIFQLCYQRSLYFEKIKSIVLTDNNGTLIGNALLLKSKSMEDNKAVNLIRGINTFKTYNYKVSPYQLIKEILLAVKHLYPKSENYIVLSQFSPGTSTNRPLISFAINKIRIWLEANGYKPTEISESEGLFNMMEHNPSYKIDDVLTGLEEIMPSDR
jgi:hypothetical protein